MDLPKWMTLDPESADAAALHIRPKETALRVDCTTAGACLPPLQQHTLDAKAVLRVDCATTGGTLSSPQHQSLDADSEPCPLPVLRRQALPFGDSQNTAGEPAPVALLSSVDPPFDLAVVSMLLFYSCKCIPQYHQHVGICA